MTAVAPTLLAADHLRELTRGFTTTEQVLRPRMRPNPTTNPHTYPAWEPTGAMRWALHTVTHQPLLSQIQETITGSTTGGEVFRPAYGSKPAGRIDCLAFLERLDRQSRRLAIKHDINPDQPLRNRLRALSGVLGDRPHDTIKGWWATARVLTQHDGPPFAPNAPCPIETCERQGTLRVRTDPNIAVCVECAHVWTGPDFGRLAIWVEWSTEHLRGPRHWRTDEDHTGYPDHLGYRVECTECAHDRLMMAGREAERLRQARDYTHRDTPRMTAV